MGQSSATAAGASGRGGKERDGVGRGADLRKEALFCLKGDAIGPPLCVDGPESQAALCFRW